MKRASSASRGFSSGFGASPKSAASRSRAACGNVVPAIRSIYRWEGKIQDEPEALLVLKTERRLVPALKARLPELHPYQVPELLVLPVEDGLVAYLEWVGSSVRPA